MAALPIRIRRSGAILGKQAQRIPMFISRTLKIPSGRSAPSAVVSQNSKWESNRSGYSSQVTSGLLFDCVTVIKRRHEMMTMLVYVSVITQFFQHEFLKRLTNHLLRICQTEQFYVTW